jgi:hypothetical protein
MPATNLKELTGDAGSNVFGFKANSRSLRPIHFTHPLFNHCLDYAYKYDKDLRDFWDKPSKTSAAELSDEYTDLFEGRSQINNEKIDRVRRFMRLVLDNDDVLYNSTTHNAPTCSSDWLVTKVTDAVTLGRFLYTLVKRADDDLVQKITVQLQDHHDGISLLMRPLINKGAERGDGVKVTEWTGPQMSGADPFGDEKIATSLVDGFSRLNAHVQDPKSTSGSYPHDLERIIRFSSFAFYLYLINRNYELRDETGHEYRIPVLLDYTEENSAINEASIQNVNLAHSEVENATRLGIREKLSNIGWPGLDEDEVDRRFENQELIGLNRDSPDKRQKEYETLVSMYEVEPSTETFEKLVNVMSDAVHDSTFNTYPPRNTAQTFGWRMGLLKPRGNRANRRWLQPDPKVLESIVISSIQPGPDHRMTLPDFCDRLRTEYGIIVGGTAEDRGQLNDWGIKIGSDPDTSDPLNDNYRAFEEMLVDLGYATKYADGVTLVEVN